MPYHEDLTPTLKALIALDERIKSKKATDFRFPLMLLSGPAEKSISVLANDLDNGADVAVSNAREDVRAKAEALDAYVVGEKGQSEGFVFYQRYRRAQSGELVLVFGPSGFLRRTEQLLE